MVGGKIWLHKKKETAIEKKVMPAVKKYVKNEIGNAVECKQYVSSYTGGTYLNTGSLVSLYAPVTGDTGNTRVGNVIRLKQIRMHINNYMIGAAAQATSNRMIVFIDTKNSNNLLTLAEALTYLFVNTTAANSPDWIYDINNVVTKGGAGKRFKILFDKFITLNPQGSAAAEVKHQTHFLKNFGKLGMKVNITGNAGTNADIVDNAIYILTIGDVSASPNCDWNAEAEYRFSDA